MQAEEIEKEILACKFSIIDWLDAVGDSIWKIIKLHESWSSFVAIISTLQPIDENTTKAELQKEVGFLIYADIISSMALPINLSK